MNNLIIIGNGFDLAHNLNTSYTHFIRDIFDKKRRNQILFNNIIGSIIIENTDVILSNPAQYIRQAHPFFIYLLREMRDKNWCDIEKTYFLFLNQVKDSNSLNDLNKVFELIKGYLQLYLLEEQKKVKIIEGYDKFFQQIDFKTTLILNFNYTNTVKQYSIREAKIVHIHGELEAKENPIIFGYAANEMEISHLFTKDDTQYLKNIKKYSYNRTNNFTDLVNYMNNKEEIHIHLFGHSIGVSDKLILSEILMNKNVSSIRPYYYKDFDSYFHIHSSIDRITTTNRPFNPIITFPNCTRMPQYNDSTEQQQYFVEYISNIINSQKQIIERRRSSFDLPQI